MKDHSELSIMILKVLLKNFFLDAIPIQFLTKTYTDRQLKYIKLFMVCQQEKLRICLILRTSITIHIPSVNTELKGKIQADILVHLSGMLFLLVSRQPHFLMLLRKEPYFGSQIVHLGFVIPFWCRRRFC